MFKLYVKRSFMLATLLAFSLLCALYIGAASVSAEDEVNSEITGYLIEDHVVNAADLDLTEPSVLPDSSWYVVKDFWRDMKTNFIFNKVDKAEARLNIANEQLIEAQIMVKKGQNEANQVIINQLIEKAQADIEKFHDQVNKLDEKQGSKLTKLLEKYADSEIKRQKVYDIIEDSMPEELKGIVIEAKEESSKSMGEVLNSRLDAVELTSIFSNVMENQKGSQFRDFKNIEVLERLKEQAPEKAQVAINEAQEKALKRIEVKFNENLDGGEIEKAKDYMLYSRGNALRQLKIIDKLEMSNELNQEAKNKFISVKESISKKANDDINSITKQFLKEKYLETVKNDKSESVRVMEYVFNGIEKFKVKKDNFVEPVMMDEANIPMNIGDLTNREGQIEEDIVGHREEYEKKMEDIDIFNQNRIRSGEVNVSNEDVVDERNGGAPRDASSFPINSMDSRLEQMQGEMDEQVREREQERNEQFGIIEEAKNALLEQLQEMRSEATEGKEFSQNNVGNQVENQVFCTDEYAPVCGRDGVTYSNKCKADISGIKSAYRGECKK